ncbi:hypothetical protein SAY86_003082 [Trapa natans]|uniref:Uncharacterized protein n=1 Tax=Trapa natans TaxID=22666 RepID=A0AAN7R5B4_TRANT|nr:hypothetical protein SAY86_003082 [Trapa natans]
MGKTMDLFLGRSRGSFKASKFKPLLSLALTRLTVLKAKRQSRLSTSRSDIIQLLQLGHHETALLRVEQMVMEQNMLDVYLMIESYCYLLIERVNLIELEKVCPDELIEAISTLIYASSRCGDFPELLEVRSVFQSLFGKEFVASSVELRNKCGVNIKMVQKMSTPKTSLESKIKLLKEIAGENKIALHLDEPSVPESSKTGESSSLRGQRPRDNREGSLDRRESINISNSFKAREKYRDVVDAAQAAFESAAYAAAAARAAVELSRSGTPRGPTGASSPSTKKADPDSAKTSYDPRKTELGNLLQACSFSSSSSGSHGEVYISVTGEVDETRRLRGY